MTPLVSPVNHSSTILKQTNEPPTHRLIKQIMDVWSQEVGGGEATDDAFNHSYRNRCTARNFYCNLNHLARGETCESWNITANNLVKQVCETLTNPQERMVAILKVVAETKNEDLMVRFVAESQALAAELDAETQNAYIKLAEQPLETVEVNEIEMLATAKAPALLGLDEKKLAVMLALKANVELLYPSLPQNSILDDGKAPGLNDRKSVHISNIERLAIVQPRELLHHPKSNFETGRGITEQKELFAECCGLLEQLNERKQQVFPKVKNALKEVLEKLKQYALAEGEGACSDLLGVWPLHTHESGRSELLENIQNPWMLNFYIERYKTRLGKREDNQAVEEALAYLRIGVRLLPNTPHFIRYYCDFLKLLISQFPKLATDKKRIKELKGLIHGLKEVALTQGKESSLYLLKVIPSSMRNSQFSDLICAAEDILCLNALLTQLLASEKPITHRDLILNLCTKLVELDENAYFALQNSKNKIVKVCGKHAWKKLVEQAIQLYWPSNDSTRTEKLFIELKSCQAYDSLVSINPRNIDKLTDQEKEKSLSYLKQAFHSAPGIIAGVLNKFYVEMHKTGASSIWITFALKSIQMILPFKKQPKEQHVTQFVSTLRSEQCQGSVIKRLSAIQQVLEKCQQVKIELTEAEVLSACAKIPQLNLEITHKHASALAVLHLIDNSFPQTMSLGGFFILYTTLLNKAEFAGHEAFMDVTQRIISKILCSIQSSTMLTDTEKKLSFGDFLTQALDIQGKDPFIVFCASELVYHLSQMEASQKEMNDLFDRLSKRFEGVNLGSTPILCLLKLCGKINDVASQQSVETSRSLFSRKMQMKFCSYFAIERERQDPIRNLLQKDLAEDCDRFFACMENQPQDIINDPESIKRMIDFYPGRLDASLGYVLPFLKKFIPYMSDCVSEKKEGALDLHKNAITWLEEFLKAVDRMNNLSLIPMFQAIIPLFSYLVDGVDAANKRSFTHLVLQFLVRIPENSFWTKEVNKKFETFWTKYSSKFVFEADEWAIHVLSQSTLKPLSSDIFETAFKRMIELSKLAKDTKSKLNILKILQRNFDVLLSQPQILKDCVNLLIELMGTCPCAERILNGRAVSYFETIFMLLDGKYKTLPQGLYVELTSALISQMLKSVDQISEQSNTLELYIQKNANSRILRHALEILYKGKERLEDTYFGLVYKIYESMKCNGLSWNDMTDINKKNPFNDNMDYVLEITAKKLCDKLILTDNQEKLYEALANI